MSDEFYSERRAAVKVGLSHTTLQRFRKEGRVQALFLNHCVLYSAAELGRIKAMRTRTRSGRGQRHS